MCYHESSYHTKGEYMSAESEKTTTNPEPSRTASEERFINLDEAYQVGATATAYFGNPEFRNANAAKNRRVSGGVIDGKFKIRFEGEFSLEEKNATEAHVKMLMQAK